MDAGREGRSQTTRDQSSGSLAPRRRLRRRRSTSGSRACRVQACCERGRRNPAPGRGGGMMKSAAGSGRMATQEPNDEIRKPDDDMKRPSAQQHCAARLGHTPAPSRRRPPVVTLSSERNADLRALSKSCQLQNRVSLGESRPTCSRTTIAAADIARQRARSSRSRSISENWR
jgi:hypothetical protein